MVYSSDIEQNQCFVETKNLDGETNLKKKSVLTDGEKFDDVLQHIRYLKHLSVHFERENSNLNAFDGRVDFPSGTIPFSLKNVLLRGCSLQNTDYVYGIVLNTG